jgi:hypothetical protein
MRNFEGLQRGKKRLDVVHYEIVGKLGEAMIVGVKSDGGKEGCDGEAGCCDGQQKICLMRHKSWTQRFLHAN